MVAHGVLPAKEIIGWRPTYGEMFPTPDTHEVVVFSHFFYGGFSLSTSSFFRGILDFYVISLDHLNPSSIVHIANFIHACESFLGIRPHFALFCRIFFLKPQPNKSKPCVVGGAGFQQRGTLSQKYFSMPFKTSNKGWHTNWFYVQNPEPALPGYSCLLPVYRDTWNSLPMGEEAAQALDLLDCMLKLKEQSLQGEQITRHFIKTRLAPIKERSRTAFEFDGKHDPNRENPESLEFKIMQERMYKIFSNAIVVNYSHLLPVVPYSAFNPPPPSTENLEDHAQEFALMKSDPPIAQRRSPHRHTGQASGGPKIQSDVQPNTSRSTNQSDSRKRKLVSSDDEGDDAEKTGNKGVIGKQLKPTNPKKKTSSRPMPKIRKSSRKPSDIDPSGKDPTPTGIETGPSVETGSTAENRPGNNQLATGNVDTRNEPPTGNQSAEAKASADQEPPTRNQSGTEHNRDIPEMEAHANSPPKMDIGADPGTSSPVRLKGPARPRPEIITGPLIGDEEELLRIRSAEDSCPPILVKWWDDEMRPQGIVINKQREHALVQAMFFNNNGPSSFDAAEIFDKLRIAPDTYFKNIKEAGNMGAGLALAMTKSLYPKIDIDAIDGFADGTSEEAGLDLINDAQKAADKIAADVVERFQDNDLLPTGSNNSDDEKNDTD
uniref:B1160F02.20 protein n=1 Tax=Oryza sativa subsp. japonica TaxID=39947 RepID=Q6MWF6_ORYSJ|nr:B1160F02.20 [Oryza sativa Japonica Group]